MAQDTARIERDRQMILDAKAKGTGAKALAYTRLSGPGWLQSAITLGGGSLAGSLYLGVLGGYQILWLQPLMMILGIVMLSAIAYVALSTGRKPFREINQHINPVLGWGWAIATLMANLVWAMPQFGLGTAALEQNLLPGVIEGTSGKWLVAAFLFIVATIIVWFYDSGGWGIKLFEIVLKCMVAVIVISFFGVVIVMAVKGAFNGGELFSGFIPDLGLLFEPAAALQEMAAASAHSQYWTDNVIMPSQRDRMVTAAATAVGINMTFLLPYSMLARGWDKDFRGLAMFDLSTGLFVPFVLATSCVVIASVSRFHGQYDAGLVGEGPVTATTQKLQGGYEKNLAGFRQATGIEDVPLADKKLAATLVERDAFLLAESLEPLTGTFFAQKVFGVGVLGMALSTIIILMLINGFTVCEMLGVPSKGMTHRLAATLPGITGALGFIFLWGDGNARFWLAVPTSVFGMVLLPIAYVTFFLMMNSKALLGEHLPRGGKRIAINTVMLIALTAATIGAGWSVWGRTQTIPGTDIMVRWVGVGVVVAFIVLALIVHLLRAGRANDETM